MRYFLDTNICIYFLKGKYSSLLQAFESHSPQDLKVPSVVAAELYYGAEKSESRKSTLEKVESFLLPFEIVSFGEQEARVCGVIRRELEAKGKVIGPNDLIIAATALAHDAKLVTNNEKEFKRVKSLKVENWI